MKGKVTYAHRNFAEADPTYYTIIGEDKREYFAHMGDVGGNEQILYKANKTSLQKDDEVEFDPIEITSPRAIHVNKT